MILGAAPPAAALAEGVLGRARPASVFPSAGPVPKDDGEVLVLAGDGTAAPMAATASRVSTRRGRPDSEQDPNPTPVRSMNASSARANGLHPNESRAAGATRPGVILPESPAFRREDRAVDARSCQAWWDHWKSRARVRPAARRAW